MVRIVERRGRIGCYYYSHGRLICQPLWQVNMLFPHSPKKWMEKSPEEQFLNFDEQTKPNP